MENFVFNTSDSLSSEPRLSKKQPDAVGFGFIVFLPRDIFDRALSVKVNQFRAAGMIVKKEQPIFLRTEREYVRLSFIYGDDKTAKAAFCYFSTYTKMIFKNWL